MAMAIRAAWLAACHAVHPVLPHPLRRPHGPHTSNITFGTLFVFHKWNFANLQILNPHDKILT
jgi:hypothetical protein